MTLVSRISGLARDILLANLFGTSGTTDAFFVAFKIPNFMRRIFAEGAFSQAFVPVLSEYKATQSREALIDLINHVAGSLGGTLLLISSIGTAAAPLLVLIFAPGFADEPDRYALTADILRITFPYIFFIALTAFCAGILNSYQQFAVPAFTPVLLNLCLIAAAVWLSPLFEQPLMALAWGVAAAGVAQLVFQVPFLLKLGLLPRPRFRKNHPGVKKVMKLMLPALLGSSVAQINLLVDTIVASFLVAGSVSWLYYSDRLLEFPLGVFGIAVATVILPALSRHHAQKSEEQFNHTLDWALKTVLLIATPAMIGLIMLATPVVITLFEYGEFSAHSTNMTQLSLVAYALGLPGFILVKVLTPAYFARQDTKTPVRYAIVALITNMVMNVTIVSVLVYREIEGAHAGLALATTASAYIQSLLLYRGLRKSAIYKPGAGWARLWTQLLFACACMVTALTVFSSPGAPWSEWSVLTRAGSLGLMIAIAVAVYFAALTLLGFRLQQLSAHTSQS